MRCANTMDGSIRRRLAAAVTLMLLGLALAIGYRRPAVKDSTALSAAPVPLLVSQPITIVPGVHLLGGLQPAAAYAVETDEGLVLIDSGLETDAAPLRQQLAQLGLDWK